MIINNNECDKCKAKKVRKNKRGTVDHDKLMEQRKVFVSKSLLPIYNYNYYKFVYFYTNKVMGFRHKTKISFTLYIKLH